MWNPLTIHSYMSKCITTDNADSTRVVLLLKVTHATVKIDSHHKPPLASSDSSALPRAGIFSAGPSSQNGWQLRAALQDLAWHAEGCRGRQRRWPSSAVHRSASGWSRVLRQVLLRQLPVSRDTCATSIVLTVGCKTLWTEFKFKIKLLEFL